MWQNNVTTSNEMTSSPEASDDVTADIFDLILNRVIPTILSVVCFIGLFGNFIVVYIMKKVKQRSITDIYVTNLAITDFIFLLMLPFWISDFYMSRFWMFGDFMCKLVSTITLMHMYLGNLLVSIMAVDRVMAVVFYLKYGSLRSKYNAKFFIFVAWILSVGMSLPGGINCGVDYQANNTFQLCRFSFGPDEVMFKVQELLRLIPGFLIPLVINCICSVCIVVHLKNKKTLGQQTKIRQKKATKTVMLNVLFYIICWLPNQITHFVHFLLLKGYIRLPKTETEILYLVHMSCVCLLYTHSCINPILYALIREDLKVKTLKHFGLSKRKPTMKSRKKSIKASKRFADELQLKLLIENKTSSK